MLRSQAESSSEAPISSPGLPLLLVLAGLVLLVVLILAPASLPRLNALELQASDIRTTLFSAQIPGEHPQIAIVSAGPRVRTPTSFAGSLARDRVAMLIEAIDGAGARAIGLDIAVLRPSEPEHDTALHVALRDAKAAVVLAAADEREWLTPDERGYQVAFFAAARRAAGFRLLQRDKDGVVRYPAGSSAETRFPQSFPLLLARTVKPDAARKPGRIAWLQRAESTHPLSWLLEWHGRSPFMHIAGEDLLDKERRDLRSALRGKIVLIGDNSLTAERYRTPLTSLSGEEASDVAIHAQSVAELLDGRNLSTLPPDAVRLLLLGLGCAGGLFGWWLRGAPYLVLGCLLSALVLIAADAFILTGWAFVLPLLACLIAWLAGMLAGHHVGLVHDRLLRRAATRG